MPVRYEIKEHLKCVGPDEADHGQTPVAMTVTSDEFDELTFLPDEIRKELDQLEQAESNYVELYSDSLIGSFAIPDRDDLKSLDPDLISFYLDKDHLVFVDDGTLAEMLLKRIEALGLMSNPTVGHCLGLFFAALMEHDLIFLGKLEDAMEDTETALLEAERDISISEIVYYRRFCTRMSAYYQQLATMAETIGDDENKLIERKDIVVFEHASHQADRLLSRAETLVSYSVQLRELYQTQIDLKQNSIMQLFTIVTVLFVPMTLVTGWFGMNLKYLPGLDWPYMVPLLLGLWVLLIIGLVAYFRYKKWM